MNFKTICNLDDRCNGKVILWRQEMDINAIQGNGTQIRHQRERATHAYLINAGWKTSLALWSGDSSPKIRVPRNPLVTSHLADEIMQ